MYQPSDGINPVAKSILDLIRQSEDARRRRMGRATEAYFGRLPRTILPKPNKPDDNVQINYARLFVNKGVSFLFGKDIIFQLDETRQTNEEDYLTKAWKANKKQLLLHNMGVNGGIYGHVFVQISPPKSGKKYPRLINLDPVQVDVKYSDDDVEDVYEFVVNVPAFSRKDKVINRRKRYIRNEDGVSWQIVIEEAEVGQKDWVQVATEDWAYTFPPIMHCQNMPCPNEFWGIADLEDDLIEIIQAINFILSNVRKIIRYHGHPKTIGRGFAQQQLSMDPDTVTILPNPQAEIFNLQMQGDLGAAMAFFANLKEALFTVGQVPEIAIGSMQGVGALSGVALEILYQPLLDKTASKRLLYGDLVEKLCAAMLIIGGFHTDIDEVEVKLQWPNPLPRDGTEARANAASDYQLGIDLRSIFEDLGRDYDTVAKNRKLEADDPLPDRPPLGQPSSSMMPAKTEGPTKEPQLDKEKGLDVEVA